MIATRWTLATLLILAGLTWAQTDDQKALQERARKLNELNHKALKLLQARDYDKAADVLAEVVKINPTSANSWYNLACCQARTDQKDAAFGSLSKACANGYDDPLHMLADPDLESLHDDVRLIAVMKRALVNHRKRDEPQYEKGRDIKGVRTVEGNPAGGLRWRVRMSPRASKADPHRLVIWLHPSGGSMNDLIERLAPLFAAHKLALMVFPQKDFRGWAMADAQKAFSISVPDAVKTEGLSAERPLLMGYSAGGQIALTMWHANPGTFGGLITSAAYPIDTEAYQTRRKLVALDPPNGADKTPILAMVGGNDGGARLWVQVRDKWSAAGVPLTLHVIPGKGHTWLFNRHGLEILDKWLVKVMDGKLPSNVADEEAAQPDDVEPEPAE